mgnify:CR=1 FL=1
MSITLHNTSRRMLVISLKHDTYCQATGNCACSHNHANGKLHFSTITIPSGESVPDLHEAVLALSEVKRAVRAGELRIERQAPSRPNKRQSKRKRKASTS